MNVKHVIFHVSLNYTRIYGLLDDAPRVAAGLYAKINYLEHYYMLHRNKNIHWNFESIKRQCAHKNTSFLQKMCIREGWGSNVKSCTDV